MWLKCSGVLFGLCSSVLVAQADGARSFSSTSVNNGIYVKGSAGQSWEIKNDVTSADVTFVTNSMSSVVASAGVGYRFSTNIRADLEFSYRPDYILQTHSNVGDITDFNIGFAAIKANTGMVNLYLDYPMYLITPYLKGGIGYGIVNYNVTSIYNVELDNTPVGTLAAHTNRNFVEQIGCGLLFEITPNLKADFSYQFVNLGNIKSGDGLKVIPSLGAWPYLGFYDPNAFNQLTLQANEVVVGLQYYF